MNDHASEAPMTDPEGTTQTPTDGRDRVPEASLAQKGFLAHLRHELRTPINAMIGYSEMLLEDAADRGEVDFIPDLQRMHTASNQLLARVNDILDPARLDGGQLALDSEISGVNLHHQLRTPLNAMIGYCEMLLEDAADRGLKDLISDLQKIHGAAQRFLALVNELVISPR